METRSAIESRVVAAAVGRDDWVILKIVDGNDAGTIIKSRSMPGQSWRVISVRAPRTNAEEREERGRKPCGMPRRAAESYFASGFLGGISEIRIS